MKPILPFLLVAFCLALTPNALAAEEEKHETLHGVVEAVDGNKITVNHRRESKVFTINDQTKLGRSLWVTPPIPKETLKPTEKMLTMTPAELHKMADSNADGELSYVEYATAIYRSPKHGAVGFSKSDKDKSGTLNLKEFEPKLAGMKWFRISRKTPAAWHAEVDVDSDGVLSKKEFVTFLGSTAHLDTFFKRADKDRSGDLSVEDLAGFIDSILK